jgi:alpha-D-ribose 1-methylphosphonate 5-triphosphate synthase subunit PhnG
MIANEPEKNDRQIWMGLLARAAPERLQALLQDLPPHTLLRGPEVGAVMVRGRVGGTGVPFNLGEMTVTRCTVQLADGPAGHAHIQGRDKRHAVRAAVVDALMQTDRAYALRAGVLEPLAAHETATRALRAAKAAATKVEFFTLARGEDA